LNKNLLRGEQGSFPSGAFGRTNKINLKNPHERKRVGVVTGRAGRGGRVL